MLRQILIAALVAGFAAGAAAAALQQLRAVPLIHAAESYEEQDEARHAAAHAAAGEAHHHDAAEEEGWQPAEGLQRIGLTLAADILEGAGFGLLLTAIFALYGATGGTVDARRGLLFGLAGFAVFHLAPAFGLPPLPPGAPVAELAARQQWWLLTAGCTSVALALLVFGRRLPLQLLGAALLLLPHLFGAPPPALQETSLPPALAAQFAAASIATAAVFWIVLGGVGGWMYRRLQA